MPSSALRPQKRDAQRCAQWFWMRPILTEVTRKAIRFSPRRRTRASAPSRSDSSLDMSAGIQYWRSKAPTGVPDPTRQSSSLSSLESMLFSFSPKPLRHRRRAHVALNETAHEHDHRQDHDRHHQRRHRRLFQAPVGPLAQEERRQHHRPGAVEERDRRQIAERDRELDYPAGEEAVLHEGQPDPPKRRRPRGVMDAGGLLELAADLDHARAHDLGPEWEAAHDVGQDHYRESAIEDGERRQQHGPQDPET